MQLGHFMHQLKAADEIKTFKMKQWRDSEQLFQQQNRKKIELSHKNIIVIWYVFKALLFSID